MFPHYIFDEVNETSSEVKSDLLSFKKYLLPL